MYIWDCCLFDEAVTLWVLLSPSDDAKNEYWTCKYVERIGRGLNSDTYIWAFAWRDWKKTRKPQNYFNRQRESVGLCNEGSVFLWDRNWIIKYYSDELQASEGIRKCRRGYVALCPDGIRPVKSAQRPYFSARISWLPTSLLYRNFPKPQTYYMY
jgi:hypothetical protein